MAKMSNIDLTIKNIKEKTKRILPYIATILFILYLAVFIYAHETNIERQEQAKETRLNNIETRLQTQMNYIHQLEADVDNLYRVVE